MSFDDFDNMPKIYECLNVTGRKQHRCCECLADITKGERHEYVKGLWEDKFETFRTCGICTAMRDSIKLWHYCHGLMCDEIDERDYPDSVAVRDFIIRRRENYNRIKARTNEMRTLTSHKVSGLNEDLVIDVLDEPGQGNACHKYTISYPDAGGVHRMATIDFQNGPIKEFGVNGISNESLLAIVEDRLVGFQAGHFGRRENAIALEKLQEAMMWLQKRTRDCLARGVEGT